MISKRIKEIIEWKELTSSKFADALNVQRSGISHVLNGRNKPSLDLIQKILTTFQDIDAEWLVNGTGSRSKQPLAGGRESDPSKSTSVTSEVIQLSPDSDTRVDEGAGNDGTCGLLVKGTLRVLPAG